MRARLVILLTPAALAACADDGVRPLSPPTPPWQVSGVPLTVDNTWNYDVTFDVSFKRENGTDVREPIHFTGSATRQITGTDTIDGREYAVEKFSAEDDRGPLGVLWRRFRQDRDALYQAAVGTNVPPGEFPPEEEVGDQVRLRFPITAGATWRLRPESDAVVFTVEARETLSLAIGDTPAWRIRRDVATAGPDNYIRLWYGTEGLLRREAHSEFDASDATGENVHVVIHSVEELVSLQLVEALSAQTVRVIGPWKSGVSTLPARRGVRRVAEVMQSRRWGSVKELFR